MLPKKVIGAGAMIALWLAAGRVGRKVKVGEGDRPEEEQPKVGARVGKRRTIMCDAKWQ